jgi:hypothetical protein
MVAVAVADTVTSAAAAEMAAGTAVAAVVMAADASHHIL